MNRKIAHFSHGINPIYIFLGEIEPILYTKLLVPNHSGCAKNFTDKQNNILINQSY